MNMPTLANAGLFMLLDKEWFNCKVDDRSKVVGGAQGIETSDGYVIPLSIESGLVYMTPSDFLLIRIFNNIPIFFSSPDTWDASVLDHGITPYLLEEIDQESDDSLLQDSIFDEFGELQDKVVQKLNIFWGSNSTESGEHTFILSYMKVTRLNKIGNH